MPIPIIPIVAALGAGAIGYYIGRKTAQYSTEDTSTNVIFCGDFGNRKHGGGGGRGNVDGNPDARRGCQRGQLIE